MLLRPPAILFFERRVAGAHDVAAWLGADATGMQWVALAAHLDEGVPVDAEDLAIVDAVPRDGIDRAALAAAHDHARIDALVARGILLGDHPEHAAWRERDAVVRALHWWPLAALAQRHGRWSGVDAAAAHSRLPLEALLAAHGMPPPAEHAVGPAAARIDLPRPPRDGLDALLAERRTCRDFDPAASLSLPALSLVLDRSVGARTVREAAPGMTVLGKYSPSGGGLHPIEAYVLAARVDGLAPGAYHYACVAHALEPIAAPSGASGSDVARALVAAQPRFADAPALIVLVARVERTFWKYRGHTRAWRVLQLDAGHVAQTLQLAATAQGLGAFVTAAFNDDVAEAVFGLDGIAFVPVVVCGVGLRAGSGLAPGIDPRAS